MNLQLPAQRNHAGFRRYLGRIFGYLFVAWGWTGALPIQSAEPESSASVDAHSNLRFEQQLLGKPLSLEGLDARWQLQVTQSSDAGERDLTQAVRFEVQPPIVRVSASGYLSPLSDGMAQVIARSSDGNTTRLSIEVSGTTVSQPVHFANQVVPVFTKLGCNGGGCHGKAAGQAGFKLSLLGFEPKEDFEHLVNESRGRRVFPALPEKSLLLEKAINASPHGGGKRMELDSPEYRLVRRWIATGMPFGSSSAPVVTRIQILPDARRLPRKSRQQLSVIAHYSDGRLEDVTRMTQFESNNTDLANVSNQGLVSLQDQSGDVSIMARYQGQVAVFQASIPLGADVSAPELWPIEKNLVDTHVFAKLRSLEIPPSELCDDATFIRRVTLDLAGRLPYPAEAIAFVLSSETGKDEQLVDRLLRSTDHAEFFARKWISILRNRRRSAAHTFTSFAFHDWVRESFHSNKPYDQFVRELLTASGSPEINPAVAWYREVSTTEARVEDSAQLFLGQRLQCARCHHHPFEKWSQRDYFQMAAFFSQVGGKEGSVTEEPVVQTRTRKAQARHPKSGETLQPAGLSGAPLSVADEQDARELLVNWMVAPDNPYFARSLVNRYWKHFFATGIVEPEDDLRVTNPASNEPLLQELAEYFVDQQYDVRAVLKLICTSNVYRLSSNSNAHNLNDNNSYSRYYPKRLSAEVLLDAIDQVAMTETDFGTLPMGTRAVSLPDTDFSSYFLEVFGKPDGATACECERAGEATLAQSLHLLNSKEVQAKLGSDTGLAASLANSSQSPEDLVDQLYLAALSRNPNPAEAKAAVDYLNTKTNDQAVPVTERKAVRRAAFEDIVWAVINSKEFLFNH